MRRQRVLGLGWSTGAHGGEGSPWASGAGTARAPRAAHWKRVAGDTLIEVMAALLLLAVASLGTVALQSWVSLSQQSARWLDCAVDAAAMVAEALRAGESPNASIALAESTAAGLPDGRASLAELGDGQWRITVGWTEPPRWVGGSRSKDADRSVRSDDGAHGGAPCAAPEGMAGGLHGPRLSRCVSVVLVR